VPTRTCTARRGTPAATGHRGEATIALQGQALAAPSFPAASTPSVSVGFCDKQYGECVQAGEEIQEGVLRTAHYAMCNAQKKLCEAKAFAQTAVEWVAGALGGVLTWLAAHPEVVIGVIVVAAVVITIVNPPAGAVVLTVLVL
jgi:hypothetical protein